MQTTDAFINNSNIDNNCNKDHNNNESSDVIHYASELTQIKLVYGKRTALDDVNLQIPANKIIGLIGPDGVGKSSLLALIAGARKIQTGKVVTLQYDMTNCFDRRKACPHIAYMPQGLGKNLYSALSIEENLQFFGRLFGYNTEERRQRIDMLTRATRLYKFLDRKVANLSGGMKQKLGLCCALIHDPKLLILDEPTTGIDPLSRNQFWQLIEEIRSATNYSMSVIVATAYMEEAERFDWLIAMNNGKVLTTGTPQEIYDLTQTTNLEQAFIELLPLELKQHHKPIVIYPLEHLHDDSLEHIAIEGKNLTKKFGDFIAVDNVSFQIKTGEIFGFLGSNGCGKTTTMKMLTGLLPATSGQAKLFGSDVNAYDLATRKRIGYMSQAFSLYTELTVYQNLELHARLFHIPENNIKKRINEVAQRFDLEHLYNVLPEKLPLGIRQRLSLAVAVIHKPEILILDEPTSGVDPIARDAFWQLMLDLARNDKITIFISTHFMNEAEHCDRISLMYNGIILASDTPQNLIQQRQTKNLEDAFVSYLMEQQKLENGMCAEVKFEAHVNNNANIYANKQVEKVSKKNFYENLEENSDENSEESFNLIKNSQSKTTNNLFAKFKTFLPKNNFSLQRTLSYSLCETLELKRDPVRATLALLGTLILMLIFSYGITMDVEKLNFAVLDRDQTTLSNNYIMNLSGSRYFIEKKPLQNYAELDKRMQTGELALTLEIPSGFAKNVAKGNKVQIGAWFDGAMPQRAETIQAYIKGMHQSWLVDYLKYKKGIDASNVNQYAKIETRYRYNPDVKSLPAMVPAIIPILLLMIPSMLTALAVVREKELGSITNLYVTPIQRSEFLLGKQLPYIAFGLFNFFVMTFVATVFLDVPIKGNFFALITATILFIIFSTGFGLLASSFTKSQIASIFLTMVGTIIPAIQFSGLINPTSSLEGAGRFIGQIYPATHFLLISRGVFTKGLGFADLTTSFLAIICAIPCIFTLAILLLKKQEK